MFTRRREFKMQSSFITSHDVQLNYDEDMGGKLLRREEFLNYFKGKRNEDFTKFTLELINNKYKINDFYYYTHISSYVASWNPTSKENFLTANVYAKNIREDASEFVEKNKNNDFLVIPNWANLAWTQIVEWMPLDSKKDLLQEVFFSPIFTKDLNGWTIPHSNGTFICIDALTAPILNILNNNLLLYDYAHPLKFGNESKNVFLEDILPTLLFFIKDKPASEIPLFVPTHQNYETSRMITFYQIKFLLAHEIGHFQLNHNSQNKTKKVPYNWCHHSLDAITIYNREQINEFSADSYAISLLKSVIVNYLQTEHKGVYDEQSISYTMFSVELLFSYFRLIEAILNKINENEENFGVVESHPKALERLKNIKSFNMADFVYNRKLLEKVENVIEEWISIINNLDKSHFN